MLATQPLELDLTELRERIRGWASECGFQQVGVTGVTLAEDEARLQRWVALGRHGSMQYMARYGAARARPAEIVPGTVRVISVRMDYLPPEARDADEVLQDASLAYVSRYALGRDYHKVMRRRLAQLAERIREQSASAGYRVFVDTGPVLEKALARDAGLGWIGKHTNVIQQKSGSWFFLGEILTDVPLPLDTPAANHCGSCRACLDVCPTQAIVAPYELDARRCISYLTIESREAIPLEFRQAIGNRIYGCDDCQLVCPWNKFARLSGESDFRVRHGLDAPKLTAVFAWSEAEFLSRTEGSAIRRIGYDCWLRNIAVALGNAPRSAEVIAALQARRDHPSALVREHVVWALAQHEAPAHAVTAPAAP